MSTSKILSGAAYKSGRQKRLDALAFFAKQSRLVGMPGQLAFAIHQALKKIYHDPTLSGPDKEREFRRVIQTGDRLLQLPAGADVSAPEQAGELDPPRPADDSAPAA